MKLNLKNNPKRIFLFAAIFLVTFLLLIFYFNLNGMRSVFVGSGKELTTGEKENILESLKNQESPNLNINEKESILNNIKEENDNLSFDEKLNILEEIKKIKNNK